MMEKNTDDDNNRCHDNFEFFGNFDDNDEKITEKHTNIMTFESNWTNFRD